MNRAVLFDSMHILSKEANCHSDGHCFNILVVSKVGRVCVEFFVVAILERGLQLVGVELLPLQLAVCFILHHTCCGPFFI